MLVLLLLFVARCLWRVVCFVVVRRLRFVFWFADCCVVSVCFVLIVVYVLFVGVRLLVVVCCVLFVCVRCVLCVVCC